MSSFTVQPQYSISCWLYFIGSGASTFLSTPNMALGTDGVQFVVTHNGTQTNLGGTILASTWQHLVFTYDSTNLIFYINGTKVVSVVPASYTTASGPLVVGTTWQGSVDDVRSYAGVMATAQVVALYTYENSLVDATLATVPYTSPDTLVMFSSSVAPTITDDGKYQLSGTAPTMVPSNRPNTTYPPVSFSGASLTNPSTQYIYGSTYGNGAYILSASSVADVSKLTVPYTVPLNTSGTYVSTSSLYPGGIYTGATSTTSQSIISFTVVGTTGTYVLTPGTYTFVVTGGGATGPSAYGGGYGMVLTATLTLATSTTIQYRLGAKGITTAAGGSGAGATYVYDLTNSQWLFVAGGGGGGGSTSAGTNAVVASGAGFGGGGLGGNAGAGGGGVVSDGNPATRSYAYGGVGYLNGSGASTGSGTNGVFGGGGACNAFLGGGGGGGYSGGNGGDTGLGGTGGTSYAIGSATIVSQNATSTGDGSLTITSATSPVLGEWFQIQCPKTFAPSIFQAYEIGGLHATTYSIVASTDGSTWYTLYSASGLANQSFNFTTTKLFSSSSGSYSYYRYIASAVNTGTSGIFALGGFLVNSSAQGFFVPQFSSSTNTTTIVGYTPTTANYTLSTWVNPSALPAVVYQQGTSDLVLGINSDGSVYSTHNGTTFSYKGADPLWINQQYSVLSPSTLTNVLLLHFDSTFTDSSAYASPVTNSGATISSAQSKFGGASMLTTGTQYIQITPTSNIFGFGTSSWTFEFWLYPLTNAASSNIVGNAPSQTFSTYNWAIGRNASNKMVFGSFVSTGTVLATAWTHVAFVHNGTTLTLYLNGTLDSTTSTLNFIDNGGIQTIYIGRGGPLDLAPGFNGYIDELRLSTAVLYTTNFPVATSAYTSGISIGHGSTGGNNWDACAYTQTGYTGTAYISAQADSTSGLSMFGLSTSNTGATNLATTAYASITYAWYFNNATLQIYESGGNIGSYGSYTTSTVPSITFENGTVTYFVDATPVRSVPNVSGTLYGMVTPNTASGGKVNNLVFDSYGRCALNSWNHVTVTYTSDFNRARLYLNGNLVTQVPASIYTSTPNSLTYGSNFSGYLDDIRVYTGEMSQSDAVGLYAYESTLPGQALLLSNPGRTTLNTTSGSASFTVSLALLVPVSGVVWTYTTPLPGSLTLSGSTDQGVTFTAPYNTYFDGLAMYVTASLTGYISSTVSFTVSAGSPAVITVPNPNLSVPVTGGLVGWYDASSWSSPTWTDKSANGNDATLSRGTVFNTGTYLFGSTTAGISFPVAILPSTYTMFHVARQTGTRQRVFQGQTTNWLSGFSSTGSGIAYHNGWITAQTDLYGTGWVLSTDQNSLYRSNRDDRTTASPGTPSYDRIGLNQGVYTSEYSDWAVAEVLVYNRTLSLAEIQSVEAYLVSRYPTLNIAFDTSTTTTFSLAQTNASATIGTLAWSYSTLPVGVSFSSSTNTSITFSILAGTLISSSSFTVTATGAGGSSSVNFNLSAASRAVLPTATYAIDTTSATTFTISQTSTGTGTVSWSYPSPPSGTGFASSSPSSLIFNVSQGAVVATSSFGPVSALNQYKMLTSQTYTYGSGVKPVLSNPGTQLLDVTTTKTIPVNQTAAVTGISWTVSPTLYGQPSTSDSQLVLNVPSFSEVSTATETVTATNTGGVATSVSFTTGACVPSNVANPGYQAFDTYSSSQSLTVSQVPVTITVNTSFSYSGTTGTYTLLAGTYTFTLTGAYGGTTTNNIGGTSYGGAGRLVVANFTLTSKCVIQYRIGGVGVGPNSGLFRGSGGGGGTYIYDLTNSRFLFVAGGGGGGAAPAGSGTSTSNPAGSTASPGSGAGGANNGGGGIYGDGANFSGGGGGKSYLVNVSPVGTGTSAGGSGGGGFGGGGGVFYNFYGGGGGGYTGGDAQQGGTSYAIPGSTVTTDTATNNSGNGSITIVSVGSVSYVPPVTWTYTTPLPTGVSIASSTNSQIQYSIAQGSGFSIPSFNVTATNIIGVASSVNFNFAAGNLPVLTNPGDQYLDTRISSFTVAVTNTRAAVTGPITWNRTSPAVLPSGVTVIQQDIAGYAFQVAAGTYITGTTFTISATQISTGVTSVSVSFQVYAEASAPVLTNPGILVTDTYGPPPAFSVAQTNTSLVNPVTYGISPTPLSFSGVTASTNSAFTVYMLSNTVWVNQTETVTATSAVNVSATPVTFSLRACPRSVIAPIPPSTVTVNTLSPNSYTIKNITLPLNFSYTGTTGTLYLQAGVYTFVVAGAAGGLQTPSTAGGAGRLVIANFTLSSVTTINYRIGGIGGSGPTTGGGGGATYVYDVTNSRWLFVAGGGGGAGAGLTGGAATSTVSPGTGGGGAFGGYGGGGGGGITGNGGGTTYGDTGGRSYANGSAGGNPGGGPVPGGYGGGGATGLSGGSGGGYTGGDGNGGVYQGGFGGTSYAIAGSTVTTDTGTNLGKDGFFNIDLTTASWTTTSLPAGVTVTTSNTSTLTLSFLQNTTVTNYPVTVTSTNIAGYAVPVSFNLTCGPTV